MSWMPRWTKSAEQHRWTKSAEYEGRALPRPDEDLSDQGLVFDVGTVVSRRRILAMVGAGAGVASVGLLGRSGGAFAAATSAAVPSTEIPEETAGPYPGDGSNGPDILEQSGIVRRDITKSFGDASGVAEGVPTTVELTLYDLASGGVPYEGVAVYLWHCTREGGYSMYSEGVEDENFLRGVQIADADGKVAFTSIYPACYDGRWPHMHFEVYPDEASITDSTTAIATSQVALTEQVCTVVYAEAGYEASVANLAKVSLATDNVFGDDSGTSQLATIIGDVASGYTIALAVGVDTTTAAGGGGGSMGGDGAPTGGGGPGGNGGGPGSAP